ncbi:MAG: alpha-2-macroglobulin family protein, partial [Pseudomonadota bacterium]
MKVIQRTAIALAWVMSSVLSLPAQEAVPDHRYLQYRDVDFFGADLTNLFDTTQEACARACSAQESCVAFTFNQRNNSCFPKSDITDRQPYVGALSAEKRRTDEAVLAIQAVRRGDLSFLNNDDIASAARFVATNANRFAFDGAPLEAMIKAMQSAEQARNLSLAIRWAGKAAALSDEIDPWLEFGRLSLLHAETQRGQDRRRLRREALFAAINGYFRSPEGPAQVAALADLAGALEKNGQGRAMISALRLAQSIAPQDGVADRLEDAIAKYGFRIVEHRVDNEAASPRICAEFSQSLLQAGVDYAPFVRSAVSGLAVQAKDKQLCIDGVKHGQRYDLTFRAGLPAADGEVLNKDVRLRLYVRDRAPLVRFSGRAFVLPRGGAAALPVQTVNTDNLDLRLRRVSDRNLVRAIRESYFGRPLNAYEDEQFATDLAEEVWTGTSTVQNQLNVEMTTRLPLDAALAGQPAGIYALSAAVPGQDVYASPPAMQWFVLSDLGLSTWSGVDGMHVSVRALSDVAAKPGIRLRLISRANAVLAETLTDAAGFASFPAALTRGTGAASPALLMAQDGAEDFAFLPLTDPAFDLSDRGVEGNPPAPPIDTFLTTDRGAYRVGETVFATALARDAQARALANLPMTAVLKRPDGFEYARQLSQTGKAGGHVFALPLGANVPRGAWRIDVFADLNAPPLASEVVLVEDFLPERIDFDVALPEAPLRFNQTPTLSVDVRYLFGAPAADLQVEADVRLRAARGLEGWPGYQFGRYDGSLRPVSRALAGTLTNAEGAARLPLSMPVVEIEPGTPLEAEVTVRVAEGSGRPVERGLTMPVLTDGPLIGIKPRFEDVLPERAEASFDLIAPGLGAPINVQWTVNRIETRYQWYQLFGNWEWEPVTRRIRVATGQAALSQAPLSVTAPTDWGSYEIVVEQLVAPFAVSSVSFAAGWYGGDGATDTPDRLEMSLDAQKYTPGDTATLRIKAETEGVAVVSVLSNRLVERKVVGIVAGDNRVPLDVSAAWGSSVYVTASLLRGMNAAEGLNPSRQLGVAHASVAPGARALSVAVDAPAMIDGQEGTFTAMIDVDGVTEGETAFVTLAAVDVGVLNLTGFSAPDPTAHYFGQRRLGVELRDIYGRLIDGMNGALGQVRSGGDALAAAQVQAPPPTEELMAFFSGPIAVGSDGRAVIEIAKPAFNGTVKLMAVAWSTTAVGAASTEVLASDPVVITASLPRFLAPGDTARLLLELTHVEGPAGPVGLEATAGAGVTLGDVPAIVNLAGQASARIEIPVTATALGDPQITLQLTTATGKSLRRVLNIPVRNNDPAVAVTRQFALAPGASFTFDAEVFAGLRPGTGSATLTAGPLARFDVPGLLRQLDRYPYGCTEQVTSAAVPLLYLSSIAQAAGLGQPSDIDTKITKAVEQVLSRQSSNGAFGLWRAQSGEFWLDAYVTDFLSRARAQGHAVPHRPFALAMDNLRNRVNYAPDFDNGGEDIAYALLVLAREGAAQMGDLRYYADTKAQDFGTPLAIAQLAAALAAYGDQLRADALFRRAGAMLTQKADTRRWRNDFGTGLRDAAAVLKLSAEAGSEALNRSDMLALVNGTPRRLSTQEAAQVVLAAHALTQPGAAPALRVDGVATTGPIVQRMTQGAAVPSILENDTGSPTDVTMTVYGVPDVPPEQGGYGYQITRAYYDMDGESRSAPFKVGERLITVIEVTPFEETGARLIVDDPLSAGLEIDNPN